MTATVVPAATGRIAALAEKGALGQLVRFAAVGTANTVLFLGIYLVLRTLLSSTVANVVATLITAVTGTGANGRITFGVHGPIGLRTHLKGLAVTGLGLAITTAAVGSVGSGDGAVAELAVLVAAGTVAGGVRFVLFRRWVFDPS